MSKHPRYWVAWGKLEGNGKFEVMLAERVRVVKDTGKWLMKNVRTNEYKEMRKWDVFATRYGANEYAEYLNSGAEEAFEKAYFS